MPTQTNHDLAGGLDPDDRAVVDIATRQLEPDGPRRDLQRSARLVLVGEWADQDGDFKTSVLLAVGRRPLDPVADLMSILTPIGGAYIFVVHVLIPNIHTIFLFLYELSLSILHLVGNSKDVVVGSTTVGLLITFLLSLIAACLFYEALFALLAVGFPKRYSYVFPHRDKAFHFLGLLLLALYGVAMVLLGFGIFSVAIPR